MTTKPGKLTGEALKNELWKVMLDIRAGKINAQNANAMATASREILRVVRTEMQMAEMTGKTKATISGLLE